MTTKKANKVKRPGTVTTIPWLVGAAGIMVLIAVPTFINASKQASLPGEAFSDQGNTHVAEGVTDTDYNSNPPTSGPHWETMADWGSYDFVVPDQVLLHNLEDGGIILWYTLGTAKENRARIRQLEEVARGFERVVIAPREGLETPFAATAWQRRQRFSTVDADEMRAFVDAFEGVDHHG